MQRLAPGYGKAACGAVSKPIPPATQLMVTTRTINSTYLSFSIAMAKPMSLIFK